MKIGIIGLGNMGFMFLERLLINDLINESDIFVYNRSSDKLASVEINYKSVNICSTIIDVVEKSELILLCTSPGSIKDVLEKVCKSFTHDKILISIASCVSLSNIGSVIKNGKIFRIIPSFVSEIGEGIYLTCTNSYVVDSDISLIKSIFCSIGFIKEINENDIEVFTELTSCSPGILSSIFDEFIKSSVLHSKISEKDAIDVFKQTLYGLSLLYLRKNFTFNETIEKVAIKGGMTEIGVKEIKQNMPLVFDNIYKKTLERYSTKIDEIDKTFA